MLHQEIVNNVEITIREAMYDGRTLFVQYSYRMLDEKEKLGILDTNGNLQDGLTLEVREKLEKHHVGWWVDCIWINGQCIDMAEGSSTVASGTLVPGEITVTEYWRLDHLDMPLSGKVSISLPIGESQSPQEYTLGSLPEKGIVSFSFDAGNEKNQVITLTPLNEPDMPVQVSEAAFSPLMTYITLTLKNDPAALAAFKEEHGEGVYDSSGRLEWAYTNLDVYRDYLLSLTLVDGSGRILFPGYSGCNGMDDNWAEFLYPCILAENMPDTLWLAPVTSGIADMHQAIRVK